MNSIHDAFLRAGFTPEKEQSLALGRVFLAAISRSRELKRMFASYPKNDIALENIAHDYALFSDGYNAGNTAVSQFKTPGEHEQLPPYFIDLARILVYPKQVKNMKRAWNFIHAFLRENEVSGIYEEQSPEATIPNILQYTTHFVQVLLQEGELSREVLGEVNAELSSVYSILGGDLRGLKKDHNEKFSQLMNRIGDRCKEKGYTYNEGKVLQHVQNILSILDTEKEISL